MDEVRTDFHGAGPVGESEQEGRYDVAIIGGGPAGLFATFYAGLRGLRACVIDSAPQLGGQVAALYPEKWIYDVAGFSKVRGGELAERLTEQATRFGPDIRVGNRVDGLEADEGGYRLTLADGTAVRTRGVVVAAGLGAFKPKRLPAPGLETWEGRGLAYHVGKLEDLRGKRVVLVGGGDSAVDWALMLVGVAEEITLVHRRDEFRALEESVDSLKRSPVKLKLSAEVVGGEGASTLERVLIKSNKTGDVETVKCDVLLGFLGYQAELGPIAQWGLEMEKNTIRADHMGRTSLPRVYAIGDIAAYPGKLKLIATGFSEAAMAISSLKTEVDPKASLQPAHSSSMTF